jgi:hypothetical protein
LYWRVVPTPTDAMVEQSENQDVSVLKATLQSRAQAHPPHRPGSSLAIHHVQCVQSLGTGSQVPYC